MESTAPLQGTDLIDCARANGNEGIEIAAQRCGYGSDLTTFERELQKASDYIGVKVCTFRDLIAIKREGEEGIVVAPETQTDL
ncbi:hypothetical protein [Calothrix sp. 336/3]|uniref:hypothetical protein n=1 Tax=Calothrix sp. 336/3 TaxID=1337936 RepID=UPI0004E2C3C0|nr:hypothetical protein [Calothrix sp. 336/3]AKG24471.1 hypothetical protein IJ00_05575 [Calothrix sp. 336/3]